MWTSIFLLFTVAAIFGNSQETCDLYIAGYCNGTGVVTCETYAGPVDLSNCENRPYNIELIVKYSRPLSLEAHFFSATNFDSKVTKFIGIDNSWATIGKNAFKYFVNCVSMDLSNNEIVTFQRGALAQLHKLRHLNLSRNNIEHLQSHFLEVSADYYSAIEVVDLSYNHLSSLQFLVFKEAPKLTFLSLSNNLLMSLDESVFSGVINLNELFLNNNNLSSLSFAPDDVKSLVTLDVSYNALSVVLKDEINKLLSLKNLNISHNIIELVETDSFAHSHYLEVIDLGNNKIKTDIDTLQFSANHELKFLDLSNNSIKIIQRRAFLKNRLQDLHLEGNILSGCIEGDTFAGLNLITTLDLSYQNFTGIRENSFQDMSNLETITFKANQIAFIEPNSFKNTNALQLLDLSFNRITDLIFLNNSLSNLTQLDLKHNRIKVIKSESFLSQSLLIKLDLSQNEICFIEPNALPLKKLEYLFLSGNVLKGTIDKFTFSPAKFLRSLDLSNLFFKKIGDESFSEMPVLTILDLSVNEIDFVGSNNFHGMNNMHSLNISHNRLSQLVLNNSNMYNINGLYLQHNNLHSLYFHNLSQLTFLDVSYNKISDLSSKMFNSSPQIQELVLSHNNISQFNSNGTNTLANLTKLHLSNNRICSINLTHFGNLEDIDLSYNLLKNISDNLKNLQKVLLFDISNNEINNIASGAFKDLESLRTLNLSSNSLPNLRYGVFHGLSELDILDISKNNLSDLEFDIFHDLPYLRTLILDYNNLSHIDVVRLSNVAPSLEKLSLGGNHIPCKDIVSFKYIDKTSMRSIVITSIDNIHHEENVNGLKCKGGAVIKSDIEVKSVDNVDHTSGAEVYCEFVGSCTALDRLFATIKFDWSNGEMLLLRVLADEIEILKRYRGQCEPLYLFILNKRVTAVFRGVDSIRLSKLARKEIDYFNKKRDGIQIERHTYALSEQTPEEKAWREALATDMRRAQGIVDERRAERQAERKRHRAELMAPHLTILNLVLYWPHARHAHIELYERWDLNNIIMVGREDVQLTEASARDVLYAGDASLNEASLHALLAGPALAICFRLLDTEKDFVALTRRILYEDLPEWDENKPVDQKRRTAYDLYKTYSKTREEILQMRAQERTRKKEEKVFKRARRLSEMQRLARQQKEEVVLARRQEKEQRQLELLKLGKLTELDQLKREPDYEGNSFIIPEELPDEEEDASEEEEDPGEYFPPAGLVVPAFYAPPSDVAKANGLAILFPKLVREYVTPTAEFLPPHVLVLLHVAQRYKAIQALARHKNDVIHMGFFKMATLDIAQHLCYSVTEFDALELPIHQHADVKLAFMVSTASDLPLLQLMDCLPLHVSRDDAAGEEECTKVFHVQYGDQVDELEDFGRV